MNEKEYLFVCLQEESIEIAYIISKILKFGVHDINPIGKETNIQFLRNEIIDLIGVIETIEDALGIRLIDYKIKNNRDKIEQKKEKIKKYMEVSRKCLTLKED